MSIDRYKLEEEILREANAADVRRQKALDHDDMGNAMQEGGVAAGLRAAAKMLREEPSSAIVPDLTTVDKLRLVTGWIVGRKTPTYAGIYLEMVRDCADGRMKTHIPPSGVMEIIREAFDAGRHWAAENGFSIKDRLVKPN